MEEYKSVGLLIVSGAFTFFSWGLSIYYYGVEGFMVSFGITMIIIGAIIAYSGLRCIIGF